MSIKEAESEILLLFEDIDEPMDRYDLLIELGQQLEPLDNEFYKEEFLVKGCQSKVWLIAENEAGKIKLHGDSNTAITKGLVYIICKILSDQKLEDVQNWEPEIMSKLGLHQMLSSQRANGFLSIVNRVKDWARLFHSIQS